MKLALTLDRSLLRNSLVTVFIMTLAVAAPSKARAEKPAYILVSAPFDVDSKTTVPGHVLNPGVYSIRIVDHLHDRFILRIDDTEGKPVATFIGLHNAEFDPAAASRRQGPILWTAAPRGSVAVRGFAFPNGNTVEFVYPKTEAVAIAKLNANSVPAIDPESEGRKPDPALTPEDREVVTLWMLSSIRVGPKDETPAIKAERFVAKDEPVQPPTVVAKAAPDPRKTVQIAQNDVPPPPTVMPARTSQAKARPVAKRLPQTASDLPLTALLSALMLCAAGGLRLRRRIS